MSADDHSVDVFPIEITSFAIVYVTLLRIIIACPGFHQFMFSAIHLYVYMGAQSVEIALISMLLSVPHKFSISDVMAVVSILTWSGFIVTCMFLFCTTSHEQFFVNGIIDSP